ncbi:MAG: cupredoxin domain-containing protein, partial [Acidimicrobiia bacterium]
MRRLGLVALICLIFSTTPAQATNGSVSMADIRFNPPDVRITPGGTVTWTNNDSRVHDVTADD